MSARSLPLQIRSPLGEELHLEEFRFEEELSGLFHGDLSLVSPSAEVDFEAIIGQEVAITLERAMGEPRHFHGLIARFAQGARRDGQNHYRATLVPKLWLLSLSADHRIFQAQTAPEIIKVVLQEHGVSEVRDELTGSYPVREFCVQYGETAFDFVSRLMEEEGIFYFFEHAAGRHTLVLGDDASSHPAVAPKEIPLLVAYAEREVQDTIVECRYDRQLVTGGAVVLDYNFETPTNRLAASVAGTARTGRFQSVESPGLFETKDAGERIAKLRAEAFEVSGSELTGSGFARAFSAGHRFKLTRHDREEFNRPYILRRVHHLARQEGYENSFEAFPDSLPFRPPRRFRKPRVLGAQTAVVVGASGESIYTDKYGRVKVQFHWDQRGTHDEKSSCWIRVAQEWAGKGFGTFFLPRVGQEVLVNFLDGDVDRPIVSGSVYNAMQVVPYPLPEHQTRSVIRTQTEGEVHNELRFEDRKDVEEIWLHAARDFNAEVTNDRSWVVKHDAVERVTNDRTATIEEGNETLVVAKGERTVEVQTGGELHKVKGNRTIEIGGDEERSSARLDWSTQGDFTLKVTGNVVIEATGSIHFKAGTDLTAQATNQLTNKGLNITNDAQVGLKNKAGATLDNEAGASLKNKSQGVQVVEAGAMLDVKSSGILNVQGTLVKIN